MSFNYEIAAKWEADGLVRVTGNSPNVLFGLKPSIPASGKGLNYVRLVDTGGVADENTQEELNAYEQPSLQVTVTGDVPSEVAALAQALYEASNIRNATLSGVWYTWVKPDQRPFDAPLEEGTNRPRKQFNISAFKRHSAQVNPARESWIAGGWTE